MNEIEIRYIKISTSVLIWGMCLISTSSLFLACFLPLFITAGLSQEAYVTLLYSDDFLLGVRVLRQSLIESNTEKNYVVLCSEKVSERAKIILAEDGWIVKSITTIDNPHVTSSHYFAGITSKLYVWSLTEYRRVIYLDGDTLVVQNIDVFFNCGNFCVAFRHSDLFNAGILVVKPSMKVFEDMTGSMDKYESYDDGDQGFLNSYFKQVVYAPMFNPSDPKVIISDSYSPSPPHLCPLLPFPFPSFQKNLPFTSMCVLV